MNLVELEPKFADAARLMEMLSQPVRLKVLCNLLEREWSVVRLAQQVGLSQPALSHHLKKLREAGLIEPRRDAQTIYYSLKGGEVRAILGTLYQLYCAPAEQGAQTEHENVN